MKAHVFTIALSTAIQVFWIALIGRHYSVALITSTLLIFIALAFYLLSRTIKTYPWYGRALVGALAGFLGGIVATFAVEIALRGTSILLRDYPLSNLYFFPTYLFGWVYGAICFTVGTTLLNFRSRTQVGSDLR